MFSLYILYIAVFLERRMTECVELIYYKILWHYICSVWYDKYYEKLYIFMIGKVYSFHLILFAFSCAFVLVIFLITWFCVHTYLRIWEHAYNFVLVHLELSWRILPVWENATIFQIRAPLSSGTIFFLYQLTWNSATIFNKVVAEWQVITKILTSLLLYELWTNLLHVYCCRIDLRLSFVGLCYVQIGAGTLVAYEW